MKNTKTILFIVPDGVGIRNYLYSNLLKSFGAGVGIHFYTPLPTAAFAAVEGIATIPITNFSFDQESVVTRVCKEAATYGRLLLNVAKTKNTTLLSNWNYHPHGYKKKVLQYVAQKIGVWASKDYARILKLEAIAQDNWDTTSIAQHVAQLKEINPSVLFITHQRVSSLMPICLAAKQLGIPVVSAIYSWDNLPKARLAVQADKYLVWSDYMKAEMGLYYPEIPQDSIIVTGTPQFEFYLQPDYIIPRTVFAAHYHLDPTRKWICFSGDDVKTSPFDPVYLQDLAEAVHQIDLPNRPQIIFRRCPVDFTDRFDAVLARFAGTIISIDPLWTVPSDAMSWGSYFPKPADISMQVSLSKHCDFVVNLGSTMAFDFAVFSKPCLYINYDVPSNQTDWSVNTIYNFQHFKSMEGLAAVGWITSKAQIGPMIQQALQSPDAVGPDKQLWFEKVVQHPLDQASNRIATQLTPSL